MPAWRMSDFANDLLDSMRPAPRFGPNTLKPASRRASPAPASMAASGPSTMSPSRSCVANWTRRTTSVAGMGTLRAMPPVPPLPGAQKTRSTSSDCTHFHTRACSRAPEPTTRTFIETLLEHRPRRRRHHRTGIAPVDSLSLRPPVPAATCFPCAVRLPRRDQHLDRLARAGVGKAAQPGHGAQSVEVVVVPIVRPVDVAPCGVDHLAAMRRSEQVMFQQQLNSARGGVLSPAIPSRAVIFGQAPDRSKCLVKRRMAGVGVAVAVPSAIWPLASQQDLDQVLDLWTPRETEPARHGKRITFHRSMPALEALDDRCAMARTRDPVEDVPGGGPRRPARGGNAELDERDEAPVRAGPLGVRVHAKPAVRMLAREEPSDRGVAPSGVDACRRYSHSMVPGGFEVMSKTTRLTPLTSLTMRLLMRPSTS